MYIFAAEKRRITMLYLNDHLMDFDLADALKRLSNQRREQTLKYKFEMGQRTCVAAYLLLCQGLKEEYGIMEPPIFDFGEHGKPFIVGHPEIHFNLSHCKEAAICFVSDRPVGVDVESVRKINDALLAYTMNEKELEQIRQAEDSKLEFVRLWTKKEALLKLTGHGLNNDLKEVLSRTDINIETTESSDGRYVYSICQYV